MNSHKGATCSLSAAFTCAICHILVMKYKSILNFLFFLHFQCSATLVLLLCRYTNGRSSVSVPLCAHIWLWQKKQKSSALFIKTVTSNLFRFTSFDLGAHLEGAENIPAKGDNLMCSGKHFLSSANITLSKRLVGKPHIEEKSQNTGFVCHFKTHSNYSHTQFLLRLISLKKL